MMQEARRSGASGTSLAMNSGKLTTTTTSHQYVVEVRSSNGQTVKQTMKKHMQSDENLKKLQERSMQQFDYEFSKKKGGTGAWGSATNKHGFKNQHGQTAAGSATTVPNTAKGARVSAPPTSSAHMSNSQAYMAAAPATSMAYTNAPMGTLHVSLGHQGQSHHQWVVQSDNTATYWTNGGADGNRWPAGLENQNWTASSGGADVGNSGGGGGTHQRGAQQQMSEVTSWSTNGPAHYHPASGSSAQTLAHAPTNITPRTNGQHVATDSKHVVLPNR